jgi:hypothetical protein
LARIYVGGAGGAPANNFIRSMRESVRKDYLIGASCVPSDLFLADVDERYVVPPARAKHYPEFIQTILGKTKPDFIHLQHDFEVQAISRLRSKLDSMGIKYFLPSQSTIDNCVDKSKSAEIWHASGIKIPKTQQINDVSDLRKAFESFGETIWIRANEGGGGRGALPTNNFEFASAWISRFKGWGEFTAAELLTERTVTWLSIWHEGELVVAQTRRRRSWNFGDRTLSGVTGITGVAETASDDTVNRVALDAIKAIDSRPHGIYGVDMTYDRSDHPNPTEINIGRFFTTHYFFTKAGLNMPEIYTNIALEGKFPSLERTMNPLPDNLVWIRGMDVHPILTSAEKLNELERSAV